MASISITRGPTTAADEGRSREKAGNASDGEWQLAQLNIGHAVDRIDSPALAGFAARIDEINALAEASPGFVWRFEGQDGYQDGGDLWGPDYLVNLSVWGSLDALRDFTYQTRHRELLADRRKWFKPMATPFFVAWWVPAGHRPTLEEAHAKLTRLEREGPGPEAFDFRTSYDARGRRTTGAKASVKATG